MIPRDTLLGGESPCSGGVGGGDRCLGGSRLAQGSMTGKGKICAWEGEGGMKGEGPGAVKTVVRQKNSVDS